MEGSQTSIAVAADPLARKPIIHALLLWGLVLLSPLFPILNQWPWGLLFPVGVSAGILYAIPSWRYRPDWLRVGKCDRITLLTAALTMLLSVAGLLLWVRLCSPDLSLLSRRIPSGNLGQILLMGSVFACLNAILEEILCRGVLQEALTVRFGERHGWWLQGVLFGCLHGQGVPQGVCGVALASVYGIILGWLRRHSHGIGIDCLVHVSTDAAIFALLIATK